MLQKFKDFASMACMSSLLAGLLGVDLWVMGEYGLLTALAVIDLRQLVSLRSI